MSGMNQVAFNLHNALTQWQWSPFSIFMLAVLLNFGKLWWSTGIYGRVTDVQHTMQPGDPYGPVWGRTILGFEL